MAHTKSQGCSLKQEGAHRAASKSDAISSRVTGSSEKARGDQRPVN
jgi:hypothetical protein